MYYFSGARLEKGNGCKIEQIGRVVMNVFTSKDLFDKVKIRKKWFTGTLENSESIIRTLEWTEDGLKRIRIERVKSTRVKHRNPNVRVVVQSM